MPSDVLSREAMAIAADFRSAIHDQSAPVSGRYPMLFGATLGTFLGVTAMVGIPLGVMLVPISQDLGWSRTAVAGAFTALSLSQALSYPIAGRVADRIGPRTTFLVGFAVFALTLLMIGATPRQPWAFYGIFGICGISSVFSSTMVAAKLVSLWIEQRRGFWLGLVGGVGNGLGGVVMPGVAGLIVVALGWRVSFVCIGVTMLLVGMPILILTLRNPPVRSGANQETALVGMSLAQVMRSPLFWVIFAAVPIGGGALTGVFANTVTVLNSQGIPTGMATFAVALFAVVTIIVEPLVGHILDSASRPRRVAAFYLVAVAGLLVLTQAHSPLVATIGCIMTGFGLGAEFTVLPYLLARYFGLREMGAISGIAYAGALVSNGISPVILNAAFDNFGTYEMGICVVAIMIAFALVVFVLLPPFPNDDTSGIVAPAGDELPRANPTTASARGT